MLSGWDAGLGDADGDVSGVVEGDEAGVAEGTGLGGGVVGVGEDIGVEAGVGVGEMVGVGLLPSLASLGWKMVNVLSATEIVAVREKPLWFWTRE